MRVMELIGEKGARFVICVHEELLRIALTALLE